jgi:phenylacetate-CoA ligase
MLPPVNAQVLALQLQFDMTQWWPADRLEAHQLRQAELLIAHALRYAPFWKKRLAAIGKLRRGALTMERFRSIPIMVRTDIQDAGTDLFSTHLPADHGKPWPARTSGSTGTPIEARGTTMTWLMQNAFSLRGHLWHKRDLTASNVDIRNPWTPGREPKDPKWSPVPGGGPTVRLDIGLSISELLDRVLAEDPVYLQTHPYTLLGMIERSLEIGKKPRSLRETRTFGETLEPRIRKLAGEAWGVPVVENYSANEMGTMAHQCPDCEHLHVMAESIMVEVLDEDERPCKPGEVGRVVLTSLHNYASPLIRYANGDYARVGAPCACGRGLPVLERVMGRERNLLVLPSGDRRFPQSHLGDFTAAPFRNFQIIQTGLQTMEVNLVVPRPWTEAEEDALRDHLADKYRHRFDIAISYVERIERAHNGKYEEFKSLIAEKPGGNPVADR